MGKNAKDEKYKKLLGDAVSENLDEETLMTEDNSSESSMSEQLEQLEQLRETEADEENKREKKEKEKEIE